MRVFRAVCKYGPPLGLRRKLIGMISAVLALGIIPVTFTAMLVVAVVGASALTIWHYGPSLYAWWVKMPQDVATAINMHQRGALRGYFEKFGDATKAGKLEVLYGGKSIIDDEDDDATSTRSAALIALGTYGRFT